MVNMPSQFILCACLRTLAHLTSRMFLVKRFWLGLFLFLRCPDAAGPRIMEQKCQPSRKKLMTDNVDITDSLLYINILMFFGHGWDFFGKWSFG